MFFAHDSPLTFVHGDYALTGVLIVVGCSYAVYLGVESKYVILAFLLVEHYSLV